ncbi:MAG: sugar-binding protein [Caldilineaceae bacterium]
MPERDEYELYTPENEATPSRSRYFMAIAAILVIAFVAFAGGMAYFTLNQRLAPPTPTSSRTPVVAIGIPVSTVVTTETPTVQQATPTLTVAAQATATPPPAATATALPATATQQPTLPTCKPAEGAFALLNDTASLGCPQGNSAMVWSAIEIFERGVMYWRSDTNSAYVIFGTGVSGAWEVAPQRWDGQELPSRGTPPQGLITPVRGFGYVWATNDTVFNQLGWARQEELGFCALLQSYERGFIFLSTQAPSCTPDNLYNRANDQGWQNFVLVMQNDGTWRTLNYPGGPQPTAVPNQPTATVAQVATVTQVATATQAPTATVTPIPTQSTTQRPVDHGIFLARRTQPPILDAHFEDWPDQWTQISTIVAGAENIGGLGDLGPRYQIAWTMDGIYLALHVQDDQYRAGPDGTDMWKGDSIEIQLDRDLPGDYNDTKANGDDYQIGVSFGPDLAVVNIYRWLPLNEESAFAGQGAVTRTDQGYDLEMLLPWSLFDINGTTLQPGQMLGFNLSVNDNDSDTPAQETVMSASPARTTHDNPTEWGTLVLQ